MPHAIAVLPGDGIGPEITAPTLEILNELGDFTFTEHVFGGASIDAHGTALTDEGPRPGTSLEKLATLKTVFAEDDAGRGEGHPLPENHRHHGTAPRA